MRDKAHASYLARLGPLLTECLEEWGIESFTDIQRRAVDAGTPMGRSSVVCAPTSSGKTLIGELALAHALAGGFDALYLVSHKALAEQKFGEFVNRFSGARWHPRVTVGISTGDREEGDANCRLLVSTYEKGLALILGGRVSVHRSAIIADELQLLGEKGRGGSVETLCALIRQRQPRQFVGLTATIDNPEDVANWMRATCVRSATRDVALLQTILYRGHSYKVVFGEDTGEESADLGAGAELCERVRQIVKDKFGPVLVFTETRREASQLASEYSQTCQRAIAGLAISQQLELFSEPSEAAQDLKTFAERGVTFHTADLTPAERAVIESGFMDTAFDVCFATSTLAAGVNFPFRSVVIPKLTYGFGDREGRLFDRSDYRNMSGRAGRLGHHSDGRVFILPRTDAELEHANRLVLPENDRLVSQLVSLSMRRTVLSLVAAKAAGSKEQLVGFFENTFYWHQLAERNPKLLDRVIDKALASLRWLLEERFIDSSQDLLQVSPLGKATSLSGLLPETAKQFVDLLATHAKALHDDFDGYEPGLIHWTLACPEFQGDDPPRFLPYPLKSHNYESSVFMQGMPLLCPWDRTDDRLTRCVHAICRFLLGETERKTRYTTGLSAGSQHRLAVDLAWVIDGLARVSGAPELQCPQTLTNRLAMLARRVSWGVPATALDILRIATRQQVPGFGRQRVMALVTNGLSTVMDVIGAGRDRVATLVGGEQRAAALLNALSGNVDDNAINFERTHRKIAAELGIEEEVARCYESLGTAYEEAICALLGQELTWAVQPLDSKHRQNVPDLLLTLGDVALLIECKTVTKKPPLIAKEEAFAVLQKSVDFPDSMRRITLGKPDFDEGCKSKAAGATSITLTRHSSFMEALMRVLTGRLSVSEFVDWLASPGVSELSRLPGTPTYAPFEPSARGPRASRD